MNILSLPGSALAWIGRHGTQALAVSIFVGLSVPALSEYVKPHLAETVQAPSAASPGRQAWRSPPPSG